MPNGCLLWRGAVGSHGYGNFWDGEKFILAHQFAYELAHGKIAKRGRRGSVVMHDCPNGDNRLCCEQAHLILGSHRQNHADARAKGRAPHMVRMFSQAAEQSMLRRWQRGETQQQIANSVGVTQSFVSLCCRRAEIFAS